MHGVDVQRRGLGLRRGGGDQVRADLPARGDARGGYRKLKRRGRDITLADPAADGFARIPGLPERPSLPLGVGDDALLLSGKPDVMDLSRACATSRQGDRSTRFTVWEIDVAGLPIASCR
jgi:hypothetical protein